MGLSQEHLSCAKSSSAVAQQCWTPSFGTSDGEGTWEAADDQGHRQTWPAVGAALSEPGDPLLKQEKRGEGKGQRSGEQRVRLDRVALPCCAPQEQPGLQGHHSNTIPHSKWLSGTLLSPRSGSLAPIAQGRGCLFLLESFGAHDSPRALRWELCAGHHTAPCSPCPRSSPGPSARPRHSFHSR